MSRMKLFEVILPVLDAAGHQTYHVRAKSLDEAKRLWESRDGTFECVDEEIEVTSVGEPEFREIEE